MTEPTEKKEDGRAAPADGAQAGAPTSVVATPVAPPPVASAPIAQPGAAPTTPGVPAGHGSAPPAKTTSSPPGASSAATPTSAATQGGGPAGEALADLAPVVASGAAGAAAAEVAATAAVEVRYFGTTAVGLVREHNEDNFLIADLTTGARGVEGQVVKRVPVGPGGVVLAVCDGMGGAAAGEVASQMAVDTLYAETRRGGPPASRDAFAARLVGAIELAGQQIFDAARADRSRRGMGTTSTVAGLVDKVLFIGQVGDSRAYLLRGGEIRQITKDQSLVNQLVEAGQLSAEEAEAFEHSNIILQALGTTEEVQVDLTFLELRKGDRLLLCSDGLSGLVHAELMKEVLATTPDLAAACARLIEMANNGGGHDNVTVLCAEFDGTDLAEPSADVKAVYQQYPLPERVRTTRRSADDSRSNPLAEADTLAPTPPAAPEDGRTSVAGRLERDLASRRFPSLWLVVVVLVLAVAVAVAALAGNRDAAGGGSPPSLDGPSNGASSPVAAPLEAPSVEPVPVEVRVRTDVVGGELYIDGVARGPAPSGEDKVVDLAPGPYRFEIRSGGSVVAAELVILRAGEPRAVDLRVPAGAGQVEPGAAASGDAGGPSLEDPIRPRLRGLRLGDAPDDPPAPSLPTAPEVAPPDRGVPLPPRKGGPTPRPRPSAPGAPPAAPAPPPGPAPTAVPGGG